MHTGYIKLWRKFGETSFFKNSHCVHLAVYLLLKCNHEPKKFIFNQKEETLQRGQMITGLLKLKHDTGISIRSLRTSLHYLTICGFLTSQTTNRFRIITIDKYNEYQDKPTSQPTIQRQSNDNPTTTNNNKEELISIKKREPFQKPTLEELTIHIQTKGSKVSPERFLAYYDSKGWKIGNSPMKDWKAAVRTWDLKNKEQSAPIKTREQIEIEHYRAKGMKI